MSRFFFYKNITVGFFGAFGKRPERRITIECESLTETTKSVIKNIFPVGVLEDITYKDAKSLVDSYANSQTVETASKAVKLNETSDGIRKILIYPPSGKGGISINTEDYICLATDQYLNDVIIDFYLQYVLLEMLTPEQRAKTHIFSSFFYNRLTTATTKRSNDKEQKLTAAQKRHERVKNWTKNVNLFEKDFIIIPINEQSHWFLAIICFPALKGPITMNGQPVKPSPIVKKKANASTAPRKTTLPLQIGSTTITPVTTKKDADSICVDEENERDEAEGDDSELASEESEEETQEPTPKTEPIKQ